MTFQNIFEYKPVRDAQDKLVAKRKEALKYSLSTRGDMLHPNERMRMVLELKLLSLIGMQEKSRRFLEAAAHGLTSPLKSVAATYDAIARIRSGRSDPLISLRDSMNRGMAKRQRPVDARSETVAAVYQQIPAHYEQFRAFHSARVAITRHLGDRVMRALSLIERQQREKKERLDKENLRQLRVSNYDEYIKVLRGTKNRRINEIIDQTDRFLQDLGVKIHSQKAEQRKAHEKAISTAGNEAGADEAHVNGSAVGQDGDTIMADGSKPKEESESITGMQDYYSTVHRVKEEVRQPSILKGGTLMPYQLVGLSWMVSLYNNRLNGTLADEMGLGKTVQTIALMAYLAEFKANPGPHLIVVPLSTLPNWQAELERWLPSFKVVAFRGSKDQRKELVKILRFGDQWNVCLTTYDFILREKGTLGRKQWKYIIVDEGHKLKNSQGKIHQILNSFGCVNKLLLTGTPLQNNLQELWSLLNFVLPKVFHSATEFSEWFNEPFEKSTGGPVEQAESQAEVEASGLTGEEQLLIIDRLHIVLRPFLLRREKTEVLKDLPEKTEHIVRVELSEWQKRIYEQLSQNALSVVGADGKVAAKSLSNTLMQLRKAVNHPYLFLDEYRLDRDLFRVSAKFELLDRMLPKLVHMRHKVLIFSQMTMLLDIMTDYLDWAGIRYYRLDGSTSIEDRRERMAAFNEKDDVMVFLLSTRAGGLGLNLQAADTVILFDSDFNPQMDIQAQDRAHRVGQKNEVKVFRLITLTPVEQLVLDKAQHKLDIDQKIIQAGMFNRNVSEEERRSRLRSIILGKGPGADVDTANAKPTSPEDLNRMLARNSHEFVCYTNLDASAGLGPVDHAHVAGPISPSGGPMAAPNSSPEIRLARADRLSPLSSPRNSVSANGGSSMNGASISMNGAGGSIHGSASTVSTSALCGAERLMAAGRLITVKELPSWVTADAVISRPIYSMEGAEEGQVLGPRRRNEQGGNMLAYLDNLTENQWVKLMESNEDAAAAAAAAAASNAAEPGLQQPSKKRKPE